MEKKEPKPLNIVEMDVEPISEADLAEIIGADIQPLSYCCYGSAVWQSCDA
jgi:hypothetical protein